MQDLTTVAYDGELVAGDLQSEWYYTTHNTKKLYRVGTDIVAFAGTLGLGLDFVDWWRDSEKLDPPNLGNGDDGTSILIVRADGSPFTVDTTCRPILADIPVAIGSGAVAAMGAMLAGANAAEAVKIAAQLDQGTGKRVQTIKLK